MNLESIPLSNGVKMPRLGYGVYQVDPTTCEASVREALEVGYRAIDTAQAYHNEEGVGRAIKGSGLPREDIFLTTKVWVSNAGQEKAPGGPWKRPTRLGRSGPLGSPTSSPTVWWTCASSWRFAPW